MRGFYLVWKGNLTIKIKFAVNVIIKMNMDPIDKINKVLDDFGITGVTAAEAMGVTYASFKCKRKRNNVRDSVFGG